MATANPALWDYQPVGILLFCGGDLIYNLVSLQRPSTTNYNLEQLQVVPNLCPTATWYQKFNLACFKSFFIRLCSFGGLLVEHWYNRIVKIYGIS